MTVQGCYETGVNRRKLYQPQISGESRESDCQRIKYLCMGISGHPILHLGTSLHLRTCKNSTGNRLNNNMLQASPGRPWPAASPQSVWMVGRGPQGGGCHSRNKGHTACSSHATGFILPTYREFCVWFCLFFPRTPKPPTLLCIKAF